MRVLMLCTGNICRSPLAAAMLRARLAARGRTDIEVSSAGTSGVDGEPASEGSYLVALEKGLDLSDHLARTVTRELVASVDLVLGMSEHHVARAVALGADGKAFLLGAYAGRMGHDAVVEDPYGGDLDEYRATWKQLDEFLTDAMDRLLRDADNRAGPGAA